MLKNLWIVSVWSNNFQKLYFNFNKITFLIRIRIEEFELNHSSYLKVSLKKIFFTLFHINFRHIFACKLYPHCLLHHGPKAQKDRSCNQENYHKLTRKIKKKLLISLENLSLF